MSQGEVRFYAKDTPYYEFSNYAPQSIEVDGTRYPTTEHYYQASKYSYPGANAPSLEFSELIAQQTTPNKARVLGIGGTTQNYPWALTLKKLIKEYADKGATVRPDLDEARLDIMREALRYKFGPQNPHLVKLLLDTGTSLIMEDSPRDSFWGIGKDGLGENWLGRLLMEHREELGGSTIPAPKLLVVPPRLKKPTRKLLVPPSLLIPKRLVGASRNITPFIPTARVGSAVSAEFVEGTVVCLGGKQSKQKVWGTKLENAPENLVYIGRNWNSGGWKLPKSKWFNPFSIKKWETREKVLDMYRQYLLGNLEENGDKGLRSKKWGIPKTSPPGPELLKDIEELRGKVLACWCAPEPCHGNVLLEFLSSEV